MGCPSSTHIYVLALLCSGEGMEFVCAMGHNSLEKCFFGAVPSSKFHPFWDTCHGDTSLKWVLLAWSPLFSCEFCGCGGPALPWRVLPWSTGSWGEQQTCDLCCLALFQGSDLLSIRQTQEKGLARLLKYSALILELQLAWPLCCWKRTAHPDCCTSGQVQRTLWDVQGGAGSWRFGWVSAL